QYDAEADRVLRLGGNTLRGNFATKEQCLDFWRSRPAFEQNHSKCVGCGEQNLSQPQQRSRVIIGGPANRTPEEEEMVQRARRKKNPRAALKAMKKERQQKQIDEQKKQQSQAVFEQDKKEMLLQLKGGSGGGDLSLKGSGRKLALKSGNVSENTRNSAKNSELRKAEQRLAELREDVKTMQFALRSYQDGLMKNVSSLDQQAAEITERSNELLYDGVQYIFSVASNRFIKSKSNSKFMKVQKKKYKNFIDLIKDLKGTKDRNELISRFINSPNDITILIEGTEMLAEDSLDKLPVWKHVKINYKAWSSVGKMCVSWLKMNDTNRGTQAYSQALKALSPRMKVALEEINCLKQCMYESTPACIQKCSR
ncbi:MAG: hypothetical protein K8S18_16425, partial [Desulfobacula sp.]|nr:hypothetical protein [Desulfobacula sp.]